MRKKVIKIGLAGTGFIAEGFAKLAGDLDDLQVVSVLTRRKPASVSSVFQSSRVTNDLDDFLEGIDCIVECSGDPIYATDTIERAFQKNLPAITMNSEVQVLTGSWLANKGVLSESEGDQPGSQAILSEEVKAMGFTPVVYGNLKGFLNHLPTTEDMELWSTKQKISLEQVTAFTDGTKIQIEQTLVANAFGATMTQQGMRGVAEDSLEGGVRALLKGVPTNQLPISDYILSSKLPAGIFIVATHSNHQKDSLKYYKMGEGPYYTFLKPFHLCHLELPKTIRRVMNGEGILLNNGPHPTLQVFSIAKKELLPGELIKRATGSFIVRGEAAKIADFKDCVPIGLLANAKIVKKVKAGAMVKFSDVELPDSRALFAWKEIIAKVTNES